MCISLANSFRMFGATEVQVTMRQRQSQIFCCSDLLPGKQVGRILAQLNFRGEKIFPPFVFRSPLPTYLPTYLLFANTRTNERSKASCAKPVQATGALNWNIGNEQLATKSQREREKKREKSAQDTNRMLGNQWEQKLRSVVLLAGQVCLFAFKLNLYLKISIRRRDSVLHQRYKKNFQNQSVYWSPFSLSVQLGSVLVFSCD